MQTLEKPVIGAPITVEELRSEITRYEATYQITTADFLVRYEDPADDMEDIEDASFWHLAYVALSMAGDEQQSQPPPWIEDQIDERGPARALALF